MITLNNKRLCENCFSEITAEPCPNCGFIRERYRQDPVALTVGSLLNGRYKIGGVVGKGGFGITYLAYDLKLDARVAVKDYSKAAEWFRKSAEQGYDEAQSNLGWMYINGLGVDVDYDEAYKWCKAGAEQGNVHGEYNLGLMYENGYGVEKDTDEAIYWYTKAAEQDYDEAKEALERL